MTTGFEKSNGTPSFCDRSVLGRWILAGVLGVTLATFGAVEELTEFVVTAETPLSIGATSVGDKEHNAKDKLIDLRAGATLTLGEPVDGGAYFWSTLVVTNGPATIVLHDDTTSLYVDNNFIVRAPGSLTIKSAQCRSYVFQQGNGMGSTADSMVQNDFSGGVVFTDLSGAAVSVNAEIRAATTQLSRKPDGFSHVDGSTYYVAKPNLYPDATEIVYDANFKIRLALLDTNVFVRGQTVKLPTEWRTVILMPAQVPDYATEHDRAWTLQDGVFDFDVETGHVNAGLFFQSSKDVTFKGKMSGPGSITVKLPTDKQSGTARMLGDIADFTGAVVVEEGQKLVFGSVLAHGNKVNLGKNATLAFCSDVTDIPLSSVEGSEDVAHPAFLSVEAGQQVTIARICGSVRLRGGEGGSFALSEIAPESSIFVDEGVTVTFDGQPNPPAYVLREASPAFTKMWMIPDCNGVVTIPSDLRKPAGNKPVYVAAGDVTVAGLPEGYGLTSRDGAAARVGFFEGATAFAGVHAGDALELRPFDPGWRKDALLWIDPSNDATIFKHYKAGSYQSYYQPLTFTTVTIAPDSGYVVEGIADVRGAERTTMRMWNGRSYMNFYKAQGTSNAGYEQLDSVFPFLSTACSSNGLPYLAFGEYGNSRRLQFVDFVEGRTVTNAVSNYTTIAPKFAVLVFGSQKGGGNSILGTWDKLFARSGQTLNDPIMKKKIDMWINGASVDPTIEKFSGGWDVISIKFPANTTVAGIGCENGSTASTSGGKYLGEMVFLSSEPDEKTRQDIERYLAKKWGILGKYVGERKPAGAVNLAGSGVVSVSQESALTLSGSFAGTLNLAAGVEARVSGARPGSEEEVRNLNPALWIDPSAEDAITYDDATKRSVGNIYQHDTDKRTIGTDLFLTSNHGQRAPYAKDEARAFGPTCVWIDYNDLVNEVSKTSLGNTMRIHRVDDGKADGDTQVQMRTGFIVQDSCRGGGTPFLDTVYGSNVVARTTSDPSYTIYETKTSNLLKDGEVYLNGKSTAYTSGFTGGPEVFTFTATDSFSVGQFGYYGNSQGLTQQGEIQGEILLFADLLDDSSRGKVESYLMRKWLGWMPAAYADYSAATLDGAGTLEVASADAAPDLASTFAGTLAVTETADFKMTLLADEQVEGALVAPQATLALPATATLTLSAVGKVEPGTYTLIDVADVGETAFALDTAFLSRYSSAKLVQTGGKVTVKVPVSGAMIILR